jgi:hypothetical protein
LIESQIADTEKQESKLLDLYLSGDFTKEVLLERKNRLDVLTADLKKEKAQLTTFLQQLTYSDADIATIEDFCTKIRDRLE